VVFAVTNLETINDASAERFARILGDLYPDGAWVARGAFERRPFSGRAALQQALVETVRAASPEQWLALIAARAKAQADARTAGGGMPWDAALEARYHEEFRFPFVLAARDPRGRPVTADEYRAALRRRLDNYPDYELHENLRNLHREAQIALGHVLGDEPGLGNLVWDWAEQLAEFSEPGYAERGELTVTYLTDAHRACARRLAGWMRDECGFDSVEIDAVGNVVGVYHGSDPDERRLLTGSHYDTVRNGGKYDGRLGILAPMACVRELHRHGRRLPFGFEVIGFAEEEGQRYNAVFLGSGALVGDFDPLWLEQKDTDGITMREAIEHAGHAVPDIATLRRDPSRYLGFVELHIEQGPVLDELDLPLGIVTSISGSVRFVGEIIGLACHAGTTPMDRRRDAAAAAAELTLYVERRGRAAPGLVATVGMLEVPSGSINVVPGRCKFSLDIRATTDETRDACAADVRRQLQQICERRGLHFRIEETMRAAAAPSAPVWRQRWERAVESLGVPIFHMPSGAGHDAMKMHEVMPQAMLFQRGLNAGISPTRSNRSPTTTPSSPRARS